MKSPITTTLRKQALMNKKTIHMLQLKNNTKTYENN